MPRTKYPFEMIGTTQGPWQCEACGELSQFCDVGLKLNRIYCMNEKCSFLRVIDKVRSIIMENDGTVWQFNSAGEKWRVRAK